MVPGIDLFILAAAIAVIFIFSFIFKAFSFFVKSIFFVGILFLIFKYLSNH